MPHSNALAAETRAVVAAFLAKWTETRVLTYKFSAHAETSRQHRNKVQVVFSKPTPELPAPAAVAHFCFYLDDTLQHVRGFTIESDPHFHALDEMQFNERVIDQVIKRKLFLKQQNLVYLNDEFSSTRVPSAIKAREDEKRARERENLEEYLLEMFQRRDPYNDGRIAFADFRDALYDLDLPPRVGRQRRQILFAFAEQDRDEMVDYASFVPIAADVVDTLAHTEAPMESKADAKGDDADCLDRMQEAEEAYHVLVAREVDYTLQRLNKLLQSHEQPPQPESAEVSDAAASASLDAAASLDASDESGASEESKDDDNDHEAGTDAQDGESPREKPSAYVTTRQLRAALESPQLVVSKGEINLLLGLVNTSPSGQVLLSHLSELYPRVRSLLFQFQCQCFADRLETYLLQQFSSFESSSLCGSAEHLRYKLKQKDVHVVVKDMKKLLLTPYQLMQVLAMGRGNDALDHVVSYKDFVVQMARYLREQVDLDTVIANATALHGIQEDRDSAARVFSVPTEDALKQRSLDVFEQRDARKLGVVSADDFYASLDAISTHFGMDLDAATEMRQLYVLADPNASGRVNYLYFLHFMYPLVRFVQQEQLLARGKHHVRRQDDALREDADAESKESK